MFCSKETEDKLNVDDTSSASDTINISTSNKLSESTLENLPTEVPVSEEKYEENTAGTKLEKQPLLYSAVLMQDMCQNKTSSSPDGKENKENNIAPVKVTTSSIKSRVPSIDEIAVGLEVLLSIGNAPPRFSADDEIILESLLRLANDPNRSPTKEEDAVQALATFLINRKRLLELETSAVIVLVSFITNRIRSHEKEDTVEVQVSYTPSESKPTEIVEVQNIAKLKKNIEVDHSYSKKGISVLKTEESKKDISGEKKKKSVKKSSKKVVKRS